MVKKCIVCIQIAEFKIKDSSDFYCKNCAEENFGDLDMLVSLEAEMLKKYLDKKNEQDNNYRQDQDI